MKKNLFQDWWQKIATKKVIKIEKKWLKENQPNEDDEPGGDHWHVNQMMHDGEAYNMTYDAAEEAYNQGVEGLDLDADRLYCELDNIVIEAYEAGKLSRTSYDKL